MAEEPVERPAQAGTDQVREERLAQRPCAEMRPIKKEFIAAPGRVDREPAVSRRHSLARDVRLDRRPHIVRREREGVAAAGRYHEGGERIDVVRTAQLLQQRGVLPRKSAEPIKLAGGRRRVCGGYLA